MERPQRLLEEHLARNGYGPGLSRHVDTGDEMWKTVVRHARRPDHHLVDYFLTGGAAFRLLQHVQAAIGRPLAGLDAVLDFAAGWGRLTRYLVAELEPSRVYVSDIAETSMEFCNREFGTPWFGSDFDPAKVEVPRSFDLIFVGSLFTHLPRERFDAWMRRLLEMLTPGGSLVFTTHGPGRIAAADRDPSGFTYREASPIDYLPLSEYASTYVDVGLVQEIAKQAGATQVASVERALWYYHDVHVARRQAAPGLAGLTLPPVAYGRLEKVREVRPGHGWVGGFLAVPAAHGPIEKVELWIDGQRITDFASCSAPEARDTFGAPDPDWLRMEFYEEGDVSALGAGEHTVAAVLETKTGARLCVDVDTLLLGG